MKRVAVAVLLLAMLGGVQVVSAGVDAPVAMYDDFFYHWDIANPCINVLENDYDPNGLPLSVEIVSGPIHGGIQEMGGPGLIWYYPDPYFLGLDTFTYRVYNGYEYSGPAEVVIPVLSAAGFTNVPETTGDAYSTTAGTTLDVPALGVLENDQYDRPDSGMMAVLIQNPEHGDLCLNSDGSFAYTPDPGFIGTDDYLYVASDVGQLFWFSEYTTVTITVYEAPVAEDDRYPFHRDMSDPWIDPLIGVLRNDLDPGGLPLTVELVSGPSHGTLSYFNADGGFLYWPDEWFLGDDTFTYRAYNGYDYSEPACVTITVTTEGGFRSIPETKPDGYGMTADTTLEVPPPGVLGNDYYENPEYPESTMKAVLIESAGHGDLCLNSDGSFSYTPEPGFTGTDGFLYVACDEREEVLFSEYTPVTITVSDSGGTPVPEFPGMFVVICGIILGSVFLATRIRIRR